MEALNAVEQIIRDLLIFVVAMTVCWAGSWSSSRACRTTTR
jgi:hypothetical protein